MENKKDKLSGDSLADPLRADPLGADPFGEDSQSQRTLEDLPAPKSASKPPSIDDLLAGVDTGLSSISNGKITKLKPNSKTDSSSEADKKSDTNTDIRPLPESPAASKVKSDTNTDIRPLPDMMLASDTRSDTNTDIRSLPDIPEKDSKKYDEKNSENNVESLASDEVSSDVAAFLARRNLPTTKPVKGAEGKNEETKEAKSSAPMFGHATDSPQDVVGSGDSSWKSSASKTDSDADISELKEGQKLTVGEPKTPPKNEQYFISSDDTVTLDPEQQDKLMMLRSEQDEVLRERMGDRAVVMFTDLADSTAYYERYGDSRGRQKMLTHNALLFPIIRAHNGSIIKTIGDGVMACFAESKEGVIAAKEMMQAIAEFNTDVTEEDEEIRIRVGLNVGPTIAEDGDLHGDAVNLAARVQQKAGINEVLVSQAIADEVTSVQFEPIGPVQMKGKAEPISVLKLPWTGEVVTKKQNTYGRLLDYRYRIGKVLGRGQMAVVYDAIDIRLEVPVAIKIFHDFAIDRDHHDLLIAQVQTMASLNHDSILRVLDCSSPRADKAYYLTEKIHAQNLAEVVAERGKMDPRRVLRIAIEIANALNFGHEHAVVHGNLKPENVMVIRHSPHSTRLKVGDFGLGNLAMTMQKSGQTLNSPAFFAPEQITGLKSMRPTLDIYSLGAIIYYMLSAKPPFESAATFKAVRAAASGLYRSLDQHRPELPNILLQTVAKAMATRVENRFSTIPEMIEALEASLDVVEQLADAEAAEALANHHSSGNTVADFVSSDAKDAHTAVSSSVSGSHNTAAESQDTDDPWEESTFVGRVQDLADEPSADEQPPANTKNNDKNKKTADSPWPKTQDESNSTLLDRIPIGRLAFFSFFSALAASMLTLLSISIYTATPSVLIKTTNSSSKPEAASTTEVQKVQTPQEFGTLVIKLKKPAQISIDGQSTGKITKTLRVMLSAGDHTIRISRSGKVIERNIHIVSGKTLQKEWSFPLN
ncbi:protein kinase [Myxococcota bacterium]|nr:protein kinase [Myxococcota bacterium]